MDKTSPALELDSQTLALPLRVPGSQVVLLQAYFELYEGLGTVRTVSIQDSLICIITTPSMVCDCIEALNAIQPQVQWRFAENVDSDVVEGILAFA